jgi:hypothetical protein
VPTHLTRLPLLESQLRGRIDRALETFSISNALHPIALHKNQYNKHLRVPDCLARLEHADILMSVNELTSPLLTTH